MQLAHVDWNQEFIQLEDVDILGLPRHRITRTNLVLPHQLAAETCPKIAFFFQERPAKLN
jgi:hypothetical protein